LDERLAGFLPPERTLSNRLSTLRPVVILKGGFLIPVVSTNTVGYPASEKRVARIWLHSRNASQRTLASRTTGGFSGMLPI
jgi:hypothetical protein